MVGGGSLVRLLMLLRGALPLILLLLLELVAPGVVRRNLGLHYRLWGVCLRGQQVWVMLLMLRWCSHHEFLGLVRKDLGSEKLIVAVGGVVMLRISKCVRLVLHGDSVAVLGGGVLPMWLLQAITCIATTTTAATHVNVVVNVKGLGATGGVHWHRSGAVDAVSTRLLGHHLLLLLVHSTSLPIVPLTTSVIVWPRLLLAVIAIVPRVSASILVSTVVVVVAAANLVVILAISLVAVIVPIRVELLLMTTSTSPTSLSTIKSWLLGGSSSTVVGLWLTSPTTTTPVLLLPFVGRLVLWSRAVA